ncbi:thioredoxin [Candidatus Phytoplasma phoenicium]|uniref:Thioredoxin n=1 Tax=Candidatus Phytoplasma phoenicium TaxID=198422 RepID=A0A0L0MJU9_9MOLU|nr:thioredoxin [Candidatus Phytoplasma phoenicium]KND62628.1 Thioredoxin [Candidatus Phytoplasma phoenicium]
MYNFKGTDYQAIINQKKIVLVDFYATWCEPCRKLEPILEDIEQNNKEVFFCKLDIDKYDDLVTQYQVKSFPTLILYYNGKEIKRHLGFCSKKELLNFLKI